MKVSPNVLFNNTIILKFSAPTLVAVLQMDAVDLLEQRVAALERLILPETAAAVEPQNVVDSLLQVKSMIATALSCRDIVTTFLKSLNVLNEYLDPSYLEKDMDMDIKRQYILETHLRFKEYAEAMEEFDKLKDIPATKNLDKSLELVSKLDTVTVDNVNMHLESVDVTSKVLDSFVQINNITKSLKVLFAQLHVNLESVEASIKSKKTLTEE